MDVILPFMAADGHFSKRPLPTVPQCGLCGLKNTCKSPQMRRTGQGNKGILIVGEAPGRNEDEQNKQFVGEAGSRLQKALDTCGVDMRRDCWLTNALICRPPDNKITNPRSVDYCRPNLLNTLRDLEPRVVLIFGKVAVTSLIGHLWGDEIGAMDRWAGWRIPSQKLNAWICPTWHPSYIQRAQKQKFNPVRDSVFDGHIRTAVGLKGRPWDAIPDYEACVEVVLDDSLAADKIHGMMASGKPLAFDYETSMLKPDSSKAWIHSCSVSDGEKSVAFPWRGKAVAAMRDFLFDPRIEKIGWNMKFENRWTKKILGKFVRGFVWDGMVAAHVLDNRPKITGLKFQSFVRLGFGRYDGGVKKFLESGGSNVPNRIKEVPPARILKYCGLDSLLTWKVAKIQMEEVGCNT